MNLFRLAAIAALAVGAIVAVDSAGSSLAGNQTQDEISAPTDKRSKKEKQKTDKESKKKDVDDSVPIG